MSKDLQPPKSSESSESSESSDEKKILYCSFCGKSQHDVRKMIAGPTVLICDECVDQCNDIILEELEDEAAKATQGLPKPREIKATLDEYVIGQEHAKKILSVAVYNHYKRLAITGQPDEVEISKSNVLLIGPTGSGKTLLAETLARVLDVPFVIADATTLTEAGYVGEDVENIIQQLLQKCDYDPEKAQSGIIYIDEIDKISRRSESTSITRDVSGEGVQQALLKLIEGTVAAIPPQGGRKHPQSEFLHIDTSSILFIVGGAFDGLDKVIRQRSEKGGIGFNAEVHSKTDSSKAAKALRSLESADLVHYGLIPELIGRLPVVATLEELDETALITILTEPKNALVKQYQRLFEMEGAGLELRPEALTMVAQKALQRKTGARGLRTIMEHALLNVMYDLPSLESVNKVVVDKSAIEGKTDPLVVYNDGESVAEPKKLAAVGGS